jgi:hypothetical protein
VLKQQVMGNDASDEDGTIVQTVEEQNGKQTLVEWEEEEQCQ